VDIFPSRRKESSNGTSGSLSFDAIFENKTEKLFSCFYFSHLSVFQDGFYLSLQRGVDWFAVMVGMPPERKYNSVLFGGMEIELTS